MWTLLRRSFAFWFGVTLLASGFSLVPRFREKKREYQRFLKEGRVTDAPVLECREETDASGKPAYILEIQYYDEALNQYPCNQPVDLATWEKYRRGSSLPVRYLPSAPEQMIPEFAMSAPEWKELRKTVAIFGLMGGIVILLAAWKALRLAQRIAGA